MSASSGGKPPDINSAKYSDLTTEEVDMELASPFDKKQKTNEREQPTGNYYTPDQIPPRENNSDEEPSPGSSGINNRKQGNVNEVYKYTQSDTGPYIIYVENTSEGFKGKLNALKVGDVILSNWPEVDNKIKSIDSIGRNRVRVHCKDSISANYLLDQRQTSVFKDNNLDIYLPKFILYRQGVIRGISLDFSDECLQSKIKQVDQHCKFVVDKVRRFKRKAVEDGNVEYINTQTCVVTFKSQTLPKYISINKVIVRVEPYVQKVLLCYNCYRYGHMGKQCNSSPRCNHCGDKHVTAACQNEFTPKCFHCKGNHLTSDIKNCPEFSRQKQIKRTMSELNISYNDASKKVPRNTYASIVANPTTSHVTLPTTSNTNIQTPHQSNSQYTNTNSLISQNTQNSTKRFITRNTQHSPLSNIPSKRIRPTSPNPILKETQQITAPYTLPNVAGGILNLNNYNANIERNPGYQPNNVSPDALHNYVLELVMHIISTLKQNNSLDMHQVDLRSIIRERLNVNLSSNSQL